MGGPKQKLPENLLPESFNKAAPNYDAGKVTFLGANLSTVKDEPGPPEARFMRLKSPTEREFFSVDEVVLREMPPHDRDVSSGVAKHNIGEYEKAWKAIDGLKADPVGAIIDWNETKGKDLNVKDALAHKPLNLDL